MKHIKKYLVIGSCLVLLGCGGGGSVAQTNNGQLPTNPGATSFAASTMSEIQGMSPAEQKAKVVAAKKPDRLLDDPEAMARILGEDKDNDGIRDDMADWIEKNAEDKDQRSILRAAAREFQRELKIRTLADAQAMFGKGSNAGRCIYALANKRAPGSLDEDFKVFTEYQKKQTAQIKKMENVIGKNTPERYWRYEDAQRVMHGLIIAPDNKHILSHPEEYCAQD
jgi:hypothetical protein